MKKAFWIFFILVLASPAFADSRAGLSMNVGGSINHVPEPRLISPTSEEVDLTGKPSLLFEWSPFEGDITRRDYYDFRVYKGVNRVAENLIFKEKVFKSAYKIDLNADRFEDSQVYTWSVRQVYMNGSKSRKATSSFKVIKR
ncbi:MAG: hypothetical protein ACREH5_05550 [Candidatus Omnitrophota bacterium]